MSKREEIIKAISEKRNAIATIEMEIIKLKIEVVKISDDKYRYEEKEEVWSNNKKGKRRIETPHLVGRRYWNQFFQDSGKPEGEGMWVERSEMVMADDVWYDVNVD